jgi:hypothetical protein
MEMILMPEPLRPVDAARILARAAAIDNRDPSAPADQMWAEALNAAGLSFADVRDCMAAVATHYGRSSDRLMPAHVIEIVKAVRRQHAEQDRTAEHLALTAGRPAEGSPEARAVGRRLADVMARDDAARAAVLRQTESRPCRFSSGPGTRKCSGTVSFEAEAMMGDCDVCGMRERRFAPGYGMADRQERDGTADMRAMFGDDVRPKADHEETR